MAGSISMAWWRIGSISAMTSLRGSVSVLDLQRDAQNGKLRFQLPPNGKQVTELPGATDRALENNT